MKAVPLLTTLALFGSVIIAPWQTAVAQTTQTENAMAQSNAAETQSFEYQPSDLTQLAEDHVIDLLRSGDHDDRIQVTASNLDSRMGSRTCQQPLDVGLANNATLDRQTTVLLNCHGNDGWRLFIPVRIQQMRAIVVAARPLSPGDVIGRSDVKLNHVDIHQLRDSAHTNVDDLLGAQVKRRIGTNQAIQDRHTCFVCRGQDVTIISGSNGLEIRATGVARSDGFLGDRVTVRNTRSNQDVQAVVSGSNEVRVGF